MRKIRVAFRTWNPPTNNRPLYVDDPLPPVHYYQKIDHQAILQKTELPLEEKYSLLGGIPWCRVLAAQKDKNCHENVLKWDDSAAKEALSNAHERLFAMINSVPCEHPLPDPDMYIDNIDWNLEIDPGLILEMEKENRYPDEAENSTNNKISGCNDKKKSAVDNPSEYPRLEDNVDVKVLAGSWNKCGDSLDLKNTMNSLEKIGNEALKDKKLNESSNVLDPGGTSNCRQLTNCGNNSQNSKWPTSQNKDIKKIDSGMHSRACCKREDQDNKQWRKIRKQGADSESQQFLGRRRPQTRYNLRPLNQNNDIEKVDSGMHSRAGLKREECKEDKKRRKIQKQGADPESQQFFGKGRPQTRYNLRSCNH
ncbi:uncharacterized protein LOC141717662 [Apium graveolens]|uniref:uncharacterized protein LOC141717662 n=1 Tax=Apium graveolens TaxID=4045 RepID=UPI003D79F04D